VERGLYLIYTTTTTGERKTFKKEKTSGRKEVSPEEVLHFSGYMQGVY